MEELNHIALYITHNMNFTQAARTIDKKPNAFRMKFLSELKVLCYHTGYALKDFWNPELKYKSAELKQVLDLYNLIYTADGDLRDNLELIGFTFYPDNTPETERLPAKSRYTGSYKYDDVETNLNLQVTWQDWRLYDGNNQDKALAQGKVKDLDIRSAVALLITWGKNSNLIMA
ncbi:hypothetical protein SAMN05216464_108109 [Mucilaginibacter pineti]|uniref:Uncharacterized protein n=1 Tax=Mucilaginibacter pineti TaxID=1391627 RepID=A0A1G7EPZ3_9SPHI|nr:hypothetical protein [Mucilaginibacter pineti]SDE65506.1 hypothetical protein SAMN05216464_108109 [Mucilaginibacter pineti]